MKLVFDLEADGLLPTITTIWVLHTLDVETGVEKLFSDYDSKADGTLSEGLDYLFSAESIIGHNIIGYDLLAIRKVCGRDIPKSVKVIDTLLLSQILNYKRFGQGHSLARWGSFLGQEKPEHEDWSRYSPEMRIRVIEDTRINKKVYDHLLKELLSRQNKDSLRIGIEAEHYVAKFAAEAEYFGWPVNLKKIQEIKEKINSRITEIRELIEPKLKLKVVQVDKDPEFRETTYVRNGDYSVRTCSWFGVHPQAAHKEIKPIEGPYCKIQIVQPDITNPLSIKELLFELGWKPTEWNWVNDKKTGKLIKSSPKLTDDSLEPLGPIGVAVSDYYTLRARYSILEGWLEKIKDDRLHGGIITIGTPTGRARHEIIANIPSVDAEFGPEFREIFYAPDGYKIVGADSSGNQLRSLAHYIGDPDFTREIIEGDIHTFNKVIIESVYGPLGDKGRKIAKTFIYAYLYAAGDGKLGLIVSGATDAVLGIKLRNTFALKIRGLKQLISKIERQYEQTLSKTGRGYIIALDGRPIFCDGKRLALNYLLQSCEKITCALAIMWAMKKMDEENIWYQPLTWQHDETQVLVKDEDASRAAEIWKEAYKEGPKLLNVLIMDGESKIGNNWKETH